MLRGGRTGLPLSGGTLSGRLDLEKTQGNVVGITPLLNSNVTYSPTSDGTGIPMGMIGKITYTDASVNISGVGHIVGLLGWAIVDDADRTASLVVGTEGKVEVTAGTVTTACGAVNQLASNNGTVTTFIGSHNQIVDTDQNIGSFYGCDLQIDDIASGKSITTAALGAMLPITPPSGGTVAALIGILCADGVKTAYVGSVLPIYVTEPDAYMVVDCPNRTGSFTLTQLNAKSSSQWVVNGTFAWCSDGRKSGEGAGSGTGVMAYYDATADAWHTFSNDQAVTT